MTLDCRDCRDPLDVLIDRESRTCRGCKHIEMVRCLGSLHDVCKLFPHRSLERKCRSYSPTPEAR